MPTPEQKHRQKELYGLKKDAIIAIAEGLGVDAKPFPRKALVNRILAAEFGGSRVTTDETQEGKVITTTEHESGRKDVHIEVNMLDVKETDPATLAAKEAIQTKVLPKLANADVLVVVVHKPTNKHAQKVVKLPQVREFAMRAANKFEGVAKHSDFVVVEHHITNGTVKVSTLV